MSADDTREALASDLSEMFAQFTDGYRVPSDDDLLGVAGLMIDGSDAGWESPWLSAHVAAAVAEKDAEIERLREELRHTRRVLANERCDERCDRTWMFSCDVAGCSTMYEADESLRGLDHFGVRLGRAKAEADGWTYSEADGYQCPIHEARATLAAVAALADECAWITRDRSTTQRGYVLVDDLRAVLAPVSGAVAESCIHCGRSRESHSEGHEACTKDGYWGNRYDCGHPNHGADDHGCTASVAKHEQEVRADERDEPQVPDLMAALQESLQHRRAARIARTTTEGDQ